MSSTAYNTAEPLIESARATLKELHQQDADSIPLTLDSTLDRDLGLDSLGRVELFAHVERDLRVQLPDSLFGTAQTLGDIAAVLEQASAATAFARRAPVPHTREALAAAPPASIATLIDVLRWHREQHPTFAQITVCLDDGEESITYDQLWGDAQTIAGGLQREGIRLGDRVALMLPTGRDYFGAFFGILCAGAVPVPLYPPVRASQIEEHVRRHTAILANAAAAALITTGEMHRLATVLRVYTSTLKKLTTVDELRATQTAPARVAVGTDCIALLQYTSGSTGQPKGVVLTHANVIANIAALGRALGVRSDDVFVSWLPLYHDMGLIGAWLGSLYFGMALVVMSPLSFLTRPARWLEAIHRHRGTLAAAPNFAYELCHKRITDEELQDLDLSSLRIAMNGAEAVLPDTLERFQERFARCGLSRTALTPVYGLAECSVGLTVPPLQRGPHIDVIERAALERDGLAQPLAPGSANALRFVSSGRPIPGHEVRIVNEDGVELPPRREGRLEFRGPSATRGYFRNREATRGLLREGWLDSGDRAYRADGEIYITGRIKDIIIRAGRHIYPDELEAAIGALAGIRQGCVAVFGSTDRASGTERVVVLAETRAEDAAQRAALRQSIVATVMRLIGEPPDEVALAVPHTVLKTSSGKIRRAASRELYESGRYRHAPQRATWMQMLRLGLGAAYAAGRRALRQVFAWLYAAYFWAVFVVLGSFTLACALLPVRSQTIWSFAHRASRGFLRSTGIAFQVHGELPPATAGCIIVANHSSYLDGPILAAALPRACRFVAKRELARIPIIGAFLRRIGAVFVERFDLRESVADARHIADRVARGESVIFFPEGTFIRTTGLLPFRLGAFAAAVETGTPIVPVAMSGTRSLLRDGQWLPQRSSVAVHIGQPIETSHTGDTLPAIVAARDAARRVILEHCGEPDLGPGAWAPVER